ncbi:MAG: terpene cyclase/mutase family protein [Candidatus Tectomicrobia bacterium]|uniref:Terpene cyclase/mutase family protein n=1 Tax=Tectimicrobiota bacterium TaxID=2528274 RepID=A0A933GMX9_UNCTE|nr:terpene cyclase/mutase family protein [Candidatus Tectomicrobia bacterium]
MIKKRCFVCFLALTLLCFTNLINPASSHGLEKKITLKSPTLEDVKKSIDWSLKWLRTQQKENGSWSHYPGVTALVLTAFMQSHRKYNEEDGPFIRKGMEFLLAGAKPNGAIYQKDLPAYNTSVALLALVASRNVKYKESIDKAQKFLVELQADESQGYSSQDKFYGGIGYGSSERPDLSNLQLALEALKESGLPSESKVWAKAIQFLNRSQNWSETNDQSWAGNDGGFIYHPGYSFAGETSSYGSMTYAGLKSFIYAQVDKQDPRVQAAIRWIKGHYTVEENPGMGKQGLYYYFHTFAKALQAYGEETITTDDGLSHQWAEEVAKKILQLQNPDGYWVNSEGRWWENNKDLSTAYAILTLETVLP